MHKRGTLTEFGLLVDAYLAEGGYETSDLVNWVGCDRSTINRIMNGKVNPSDDLVLTIIRELELDEGRVSTLWKAYTKVILREKLPADWFGRMDINFS